MNVPVAPSARIALPPVVCVNWAGLAVIAGLVLLVLLASLRSVAVTVNVPFVLNVTGRTTWPAVNIVLAGSVAPGSVAVMPIVSVGVLTRFQLASTAFTEMLNPLKALWAEGVPVLPVALPGEAVSPGTRSCNLVKAPGLTVNDGPVLAVMPE